MLGLAALFGAGALVSGALGMTSLAGGDTQSTSTADATDASTTTEQDATTAAAEPTTSDSTTTETTTDATTTSAAVAPSYTPSLSTDQPDYAPGSTVVLTGHGWAPNDAIHVFVNDDKGQSWSYSGDANADTAGAFSLSFQLPGAFIATYAVTATGAVSGAATTSFTDGNIVLQLATTDNAANGVAGFAWSANWSLWQGTGQNPNSTCSGSPTELHTTTYTLNTVDSGGQNTAPAANGNASAKVTGVQARGSFATQYAFDYWSASATDTTHITLGCVVGANNGTLATYFAHFRLADSTPPANASVAINAGAAFTNNATVSLGLAATDAVGVSAYRIANGSDCSSATFVAVTSATSFTATVPHTLTAGDGTKTVCAQFKDAAGNTSSTATDTITLDTAAPAISCGAADGAWHGANVSIACTASDGGSGLASSGDAAFSLSTSVAAGVETSNASTGTRSVFDKAGNSAQAGPVGGNEIDRKAPTVSCGAADGSWHAADVSIGCTAADGGAGVAPGGSSFTLATSVAPGTETANAATATSSVADVVGNTATAGPITGNKVDKKAPTVSCGAADAGWHASDVSIACTASDAGSGLASAGDGSFNLTTSVPSGTETANASTSSRSVADAVGNSATAGPVGGNKVDKKAPSLSCASADGVWHGDNVTIPCTATDGGSGLASATDASFGLATAVADGAEDASASTGSHGVSDAVGHTVTAGPIGGNMVDRKAPVLSCTGPDSGVWHGDNVTVNCTASDGGSGLDLAADASFSLPTSVAAGEETATALTDPKLVSDHVGHSIQAGPFTFKIDRKAPEVDCASADGVWHPDNVNVHCTASDGGAGISAGDGSFELTTSVAAGTETSNASTNGRSIVDAVGNSATAGPVGGNQIDRKAPQLATCDAPDGAWHADNVALECHYTDGGAGPAAQDVVLKTSVAGGNETSDAAASADGGPACDGVGNCAPSPGDIGGNKIDRKAPQLASCDTSDGVWHADNVTLQCHFTDGGAGPAAQDIALTTSIGDGEETSDASASAGGVGACDSAGNCAASPGDIAHNKIDRKAPQLASCDTADGAWHNANVTLQCGYSDGGSGPAAQSVSLFTHVDAGEETADAAASAGGAKACDSIGNCASSPGDIGQSHVDRKTPQLTSCESADAGWHASNVTLKCHYSDGGSGPATQDVELATNVADGAETATAAASANGAQACDAANNCAASPANIAGNKIDRNAPELSSCDMPDGAWHADNVTLKCRYGDGGSGPATQDVSLTTGVAPGAEVANAAASAAGHAACDDVHNCAASPADIGGNKIDRRAPQLTSCETPDGAWHGDNVTLHCQYSDGGSGPATRDISLSTAVVSGAETANASASAVGERACDAVENCASSPNDVAGNKIDRKAPAVICTPPNATAWLPGNVDVSCTATDGGAGLADAADATFALSTTVADDHDDASASTGSRLVKDAVGNGNTAGPYSFKIDRKVPSVTCAPPSGASWHGSNVTVSCSASDSGSGLANPADATFQLATSVADGAEDASAATPSRGVADAVGHSNNAGPYSFKVDRKAPQLSSCDAADSAWHAGNVTLKCHYSDGGAGPATQDVTLSTAVSGGMETANAAASAGGARACDGVNNCAASPGDISGNKIDRKAPVITVTTPLQGSAYLLGQSVSAAYGCSDGGAGPATCSGNVASGSNINTSSVGAKTFTVNASDSVGNTSTLVRDYNVNFNFHGFFQPVDNTIWNGAQAGSAIPVKFDLAGNQGLNIFSTGYPKVTLVTCPSATSVVDAIEETLAATNSGLQYDATTNAPYGQYIYVWKTDKAWAGTCRQLDVKLIDGKTSSAKFQFKK